jgi:hypothetical protein
MDTKYLNDIPNYYVPTCQLGLPRFQYTIRDEFTGALFLSCASELGKTYVTLAITRLLAHLKANADVENSHATIGPEFYGIESFTGLAQFMTAAGAYQIHFNFARKNRARPPPNCCGRRPLLSALLPCSCLSFFFPPTWSTSVWIARKHL